MATTLTLRTGDHPVTLYFTLREYDGSTADLSGLTIKLTLEQRPGGPVVDLTGNDEGSGVVSVVFPPALWERFRANVPARAFFTASNNGAFVAEYPEGRAIDVEIQQGVSR